VTKKKERNVCNPHPGYFIKRPLTKCPVRIHLPKKNPVDVTSLRRTPTSITIHPVSLFSILDHYLRRTDAQDRVIGTLLGIHTDNEVEVRSSFAVLHSETDEQVAVDTDYHQTMYELHHKVNPKEVIVGWFVHYLFSMAFF
jgi:translation initiation factor 3 subunit F